MTPRQRFIEELRTVVLPWYGIDFAAVKSPLRFHRIKRARDACSWYLWTVHKLPATKIGAILGDKNHTSILIGIGRHCARAGLYSPQRVSYEGKVARNRRERPVFDGSNPLFPVIEHTGTTNHTAN